MRGHADGARAAGPVGSRRVWRGTRRATHDHPGTIEQPLSRDLLTGAYLRGEYLLAEVPGERIVLVRDTRSLVGSRDGPVLLEQAHQPFCNRGLTEDDAKLAPPLFGGVLDVLAAQENAPYRQPGTAWRGPLADGAPESGVVRAA